MPEEVKKFEISDRLFKLFIVLVLGVLVFWAVSALVALNNLPEFWNREITVSAEGRAFVKPDIALIKLGVQSEGMKVQDVFQDNAEKMNAVLKEIKDLDVEEKDIQTANYSLFPRYEWSQGGERIFRGYTLSQEIRVKIRNFEKIGEVLGKSTEKGANLVGELQFTVDDSEKIREVARKEAIEKAKAKAAQIANQTGLKLAKIINVYEDYLPEPLPYRQDLQEGMGGAGETISPPQIEPGEEEVIITISLVYRVR